MPLLLISRLVEKSVGLISLIDAGLNKTRQLRASFAGPEQQLSAIANPAAGSEMSESRR
jgi:hypothetical protein